MQKPISLRKAIEARNPDLKKNPDKLKLYAGGGHIATRFGSTETLARGYEYRYALNVTIINFTGVMDTLILPVTDWLREHQPDLLLNPDRADQAVAFVVDYIDAQTCDVSLTINLTESVDIASVDGQTAAQHRPALAVLEHPLSDPPSRLAEIFDGFGQITPPQKGAD